MTAPDTLRDEVAHWFFDDYFNEFIAIGANKADPDKILAYWGVPVHMSGPTHSKWINSSAEVVSFLQEMQAALKQAGYTHTEVIDRKITIYGETASRVETIMSRRRGDRTEMDRAAISFELRRQDQSWIIISATARPTLSSKLQHIWP